MTKWYATSSRSMAAVALTVGCAVLLAAGCAANPTNARLESARSALEAARADTVLAATSPVEYNRATAAFDRAEKSWRSGADEAEVDHQAFLAQRQIELATTTGSRRQVERSIEQTSRERDEIRLQASRREADAAQSQAQTAQSQLQTAQARAADAQSQAAVSQTRAAESQARADALAQRLESLEAKPTDRGLVITFSDVLFDTGQAELRPAAAARISQLAQVMKEYPERRALIEGFTDSTGSLETNQQLSERRAMSVRREMIDQGIAPNRLVTQGHANRFPLADNTSASGRQQNRRVEVVLSNPKGDLPVRR